MRILTLTLAVFTLAPTLPAALTADQKEFDFRVLAASYAKNYAPYEWKKQLFGFDLYNISPWIARARATATDLDYYQVCGEYVASLRDSHSSFSFPTSFRYSLPLHADYYEDVPRIDAISRLYLPATQFPIQTGDEVVALGGEPVAAVVQRLSRTVYAANDSALRRTALQRAFGTSEAGNTRAASLPDELEITIRSRSTGELAHYVIPVIKSGTPLASGGTTPSTIYRALRQRPAAAAADGEDSLTEPWLAPLAALGDDAVPGPEWGEALPDAAEVLGFGTRPGFPLPSGFVQRLGRLSTDAFFSGAYTAGGKRLGYIRIPTFNPAIGATAALRQFETEMTFFNGNTDGLIVDIMRNSGGLSCYNEEIQRRLIPYTFRGIGREIRATYDWVSAFYDTWERARNAGAPAEVLSQLEANYREIEAASRQSRGRSGPLPICASTLFRAPHETAYTKPLLVVADEYSASASDAFAAVIQDSGRGSLFGFRTNGAGGTTAAYGAGPYSEATASNTIAMHHRVNPVNVPGYPATHYVENAGVFPNIPYDYMSLSNLLSGGAQFRDAVTEAILAEIAK